MTLALPNPQPRSPIPDRPPVIQLSEIYKIYGSDNTEVRALNGVNLVVESGEYCSIMGASGSGKSTMMNVIGCLDRPSSGRYQLDGIDVAELNEKDLATVRNRKLGFVFQQFHLLPQLSALENVMLPMVYAGVPSGERRQRALDALGRVGLGNRVNNRPNQLSGGQQQRVAIARAIVNRPIVLLADEPTGALDTKTTQEVLDIFEELNQSGMTVVMVTHEPEVARRTHRVVWFRDGQVLHDRLHPEDLGQVTAVA
ncbi:ABC transporter ATP-binding protein [Limnothrix sp. FACHB-708]|uniref:ABC transporter ATP-binding protein n=1 Tax=unclassified Limnothrix TaxID=2632864 RepID=UPI00081E41EA|nr:MULTISPECIES: ABC transporter ATP-binding protein [unclassified Limnothrix]OCQ96699.1 ABC transporter [Limnothrix sp. P13C2]MBD2161531.1 ABC transporter ATP-binding protein [Limnothrix sp. FACHB-1083]MBD2192245.1 ABC transporter ATP-binding protein [Limnothrix sp. FACHB-1088]MBD2552957.1 ABC transporter ATP-binding protein [Limnothrix sp. FACHB-708]MBD2589231.1 ABC transporter ATP-binding protein [Limnothrix sp. FACHB-406]